MATSARVRGLPSLDPTGLLRCALRMILRASVAWLLPTSRPAMRKCFLHGLVFSVCLAPALLVSPLSAQVSAVPQPVLRRPPFWVRLSSAGKFNVYFAPSMTGPASSGELVAVLRLTSSSPLSGAFPAIEEQAHVSAECSGGRYTVHDHTTRSTVGETRLVTPLVQDALFSGSSSDWIQRAVASLCGSLMSGQPSRVLR
jgi:hypothetical protein